MPPNEFIAPEDYDSWMTRGLPEIDDIVLTTEAPLGEIALIKDKNVALAQRIITLRGKKHIVFNPFLKYYFQDDTGQHELQSRASGTTVFGIKASVLKKVPVSLPPLTEQKAIAAVLSSLDDKIDLLHRQNRTLEAMAETLFRQWFVVEARTDWNEYAISDFADHIKINIVPSKNADSIFHHYSLPAYDAGQNAIVELGAEILSNKYKVIENSILVSKLNPRFPRIWAIGYLHKKVAICSTEFQVLKPKSESLFGYLYFLLHSNDVKEELAMASSGTSGSHQRVKPEDIFNVKTLLPSVSLAEKFSNQVLPNIKKIEANRIQIRTLQTLCDTLLPKLMSGEVRVKFTSEATHHASLL